MSPSLSNDELVVLNEAFRAVCTALGLGARADDNKRPKRLPKIIISLANAGEMILPRLRGVRSRLDEGERAGAVTALLACAQLFEPLLHPFNLGVSLRYEVQASQHPLVLALLQREDQADAYCSYLVGLVPQGTRFVVHF